MDLMPFLDNGYAALCPAPEHVTPDYLRWINDREVTRWMETGIFPVRIDDLAIYLDTYYKELFAVGCYNEAKDSWDYIGHVRLIPRWSHRTAEYGIMIGARERWGKGYGESATALAMIYAFGHLGLNKVHLGVVEANISAVHMYSKIGFKEEGRLKNHFYYNFQWHDILQMALFREDWV